MSFLESIATLLVSGTLLVSNTLTTACPQHDPNGLLLVNRSWRISGEYVPELRLAKVQGQVKRLQPHVADALEAMYAAAKQEAGVTLVSVSGYRAYDKQERIYRNKLKSVHGDVEKANEYVAPPGTSEHQTGLTMDVGQKSLSSDKNLSGAFGDSRGGIWLRDNCWRFGFIIRYQEGWEEITGYESEPWHVRYVGPEVAARLHENSMPLEDFLRIERTAVMVELLTQNQGNEE